MIFLKKIKKILADMIFDLISSRRFIELRYEQRARMSFKLLAEDTSINYNIFTQDLNVKKPYVFGSCLCREQHFHMPLYVYWARVLKERPKLHRKQWEWVYICQALYEREMLVGGKTCLGFGVGKEPLASLFASYGNTVTATDLDLSKAKELGWVDTNQHSDSLLALNEFGLCDDDKFQRLVNFRNVDMNDIPSDIKGYDYCWSSCAFEHLGSIEKGLQFVINSINTLKSGGIAIHTTEFNLTSNEHTIDNNPSFVMFRRKDIEQLVEELEKLGHVVEKVDFTSGSDVLEEFVDLPPYAEDGPHLRLQLAGQYTSTSIGLIIYKK